MDMLTPPNQSPTASISSLESTELSFNFNGIVILAAMLLCALVCGLGLNSMLDCVATGTHRALTGRPVHWVASRRQNSGLKKEDMLGLPTSTFATSGSPSSISSCVICLQDFSDGERIRVIPECNHRFHVACIDTWLRCHSSCPTCRNQLKSNDSITRLEIVTAM